MQKYISSYYICICFPLELFLLSRTLNRYGILVQTENVQKEIQPLVYWRSEKKGTLFHSLSSFIRPKQLKETYGARRVTGR